MYAHIVLGRILQKFMDLGVSKFEDYNQFGYISMNKSSITVSREQGEDTIIPFEKLIIGIKSYQDNPDLYKQNTTALRNIGITHITSPIFSLLHILPKEAYLI